MSARGRLASRLRSDLPGIVWPPVSTGSVATLVSLVQHLDETQWMSAEDLATHQYRQLAALTKHAARHSRQFRERLSRARLTAEDLSTPDGLRQLPVLTRRDIQSAGADLFCAEVPAGHAPSVDTKTSGSTGEPVAVKRTAVDQLFWSATTVRDHLWHERDITKGLSAVRANILAYGRAASWGPPMSLLFTTGPSQQIPITTDAAQQTKWLTDFNPDSVVIYPTSLAALADHFQRHDLSLPGLRHIRTIGETLSPALRARAREVFAAKVEDLYSSQEVGTIAIQCPDGDLYHVMAESVLVELLDASGAPCKDGEVGRVVVTDLHNFATPLVRYDIGDYAERAGACPCGRGLPSLRRILGRERNLIVMPDGTRHWPLTGFTRFRDIAPIRQYQFIQQDRERIEVRLVVDEALSSAHEAELRALIQRVLGHPFTLSFVYFAERIPRAPGGKFEEFICNVVA
jgi:phenylacetate-CoA ligase